MSPPSAKPRFEARIGLSVARELCAALKPACARLIVAGSLRRRKPTIGDVEILYVSTERVITDPGDMFAQRTVQDADSVIARLEADGVLERRLNSMGREMFGPVNKLMRHRATGLPVDLFAATEANWWNYLVCRTGPGESNIRIASAAKVKGWKWNPYGEGFSRDEEMHRVTSEKDVFDFVGLPYAEPQFRL